MLLKTRWMSSQTSRNRRHMLRTVFRLWAGSASTNPAFFFTTLHNCPRRRVSKDIVCLRAARELGDVRMDLRGARRSVEGSLHRSCPVNFASRLLLQKRSLLPLFTTLTSKSFCLNSRDAGSGPSASAGIHCLGTFISIPHSADLAPRHGAGRDVQGARCAGCTHINVHGPCGPQMQAHPAGGHDEARKRCQNQRQSGSVSYKRANSRAFTEPSQSPRMRFMISLVIGS